MELREASARYQLAPRYKQTEVGLIPEDWEIRQAGDLKPFVTSGSRGWAVFYSDRGAPFIRITNLSRSCIYPSLDDLRFVNLPVGDSEGERTQLHDGDVLISITADIGIVGYVGEFVPRPSYINQHIALLRFNSSQVSSKFISYFLASEQPQKIFRALTDSGAKAGMNLTTVQQIRLALPPTKAEQEAIADALSDADALIESLEQLLAKKRHLKQGAMQQLLTGKKRLPGFSGEWEVKALGEVAELLKGSGLSKTKLSLAGSRPCILYGELFTNYDRVVRHVFSRTDSKEGLISKAGDVLMPGSTTTTGADLATASALLVGEVALGGDINVIRKSANNYDSIFLASYLTYIRRDAIAEMSQGITIHHLYGRDLRKLSLQLPPLAEQVAIATLLSDMDAEIATLETKLAKARSLKQGMMQALLTGRIRLIQPA